MRIPTGLSQWRSSWIVREKNNKYKNGKHCHDQRKHFYMFLISVDVMLGKEALVVHANLIQLMAANMDNPISHVRGWVKIWITIVVARSYAQMICRN